MYLVHPKLQTIRTINYRLPGFGTVRKKKKKNLSTTKGLCPGEKKKKTYYENLLSEDAMSVTVYLASKKIMK